MTVHWWPNSAVRSSYSRSGVRTDEAAPKPTARLGEATRHRRGCALDSVIPSKHLRLVVDDGQCSARRALASSGYAGATPPGNSPRPI
jgi:hypothetical protein